MRFLLIDDDSSNNLLTKISLKKVIVDAEVVAFTMPDKGLEYIENEFAQNPFPTILFLDINMPMLSGWDVLDKMETLDSSIKKYFTVYMLSSSVDPSDKQRAANNPLVSGYIEKPLNREFLRELFSIPQM